MRPFSYERASDLAGAVKAVAATPGARFLGGGTNLLDLMKTGIEQPTHLVDISRLPLAGIEATPEGGLRIGGVAINSHVAADRVVRATYPVLAQAILAGGSAQLRNKATVGGNLVQRTRCAYFYDTSKPCNKRAPGSGCSALGGLTRNSAILGTSDHCIATHASDMAVALVALEAQVEIATPAGATRTLAIKDLHRLPGVTPQVETDLAHGELITAVILPPAPPKGQIYRKVRDRASFAGGLASVAVVGQTVALGAVAHRPWLATGANEALKAGASAPAALAVEMAQAEPRGSNHFKIDLVSRLAVAALIETGGETRS